MKDRIILSWVGSPNALGWVGKGLGVEAKIS